MVRIVVRVNPRASRNRITVAADGSLVVHVTSAPVDGAANRAVIETIADAFNLTRRAISIAKGETSRTKTIELQIDQLTLDDRLAALSES